MNIIPFGDRLIVKPNKKQTKTSAGILIPDTAKELPLQGIVMAKGDENMEVSVGTEIIYGKYAGIKIENEGEEFLILQYDDILGIINK